MRTVTELKKLPPSELGEAIKLDVINCRKGREIELNAGYLERHPKVKEVPDFILESIEQLTMYYVQGGLEALLRFAIQDIQHTEVLLEHIQDELKDALKMSI